MSETKEQRRERKDKEKADRKQLKEQAKQQELEELEIDLSKGVPLSKKQQRLLKKGKLDVDKLNKKHPAPKPILTKEQEEEEAKKSKKSPYGVWIGNLSFDTGKEDLVRFIVSKTAGNEELPKVESIDITRINLPKKGTKIKGFAYLDLPSAEHVKSVVALSEQNLNGRNVLIKDSKSFEGRPEASAVGEQKNPPSRILFVGNLSFDTTQDNLEEHFKHCGEIVRIRMATFEDSGKCKGFAFIDFKDESGPTNALKSKLTKMFINRPLRMEYGEDRSKRTPRAHARERVEGDEPAERVEEPAPRASAAPRAQADRPKRRMAPRDESNKRVKSSVALATAQRASAAIVPSAGKKIKFD